MEKYYQLALDYIEGIHSGQIIACKQIKLAVARHLNDLEKGKSSDFPFVFSEKYAKAAIAAVRLNRHTSGEVEGLLFQLEGWQCFIIWSIYGWRNRNNIKLRRFRKVYIKVPRKNGKTEFLAALANIEMILFSTKGGGLFWAATKKEQARIGWERQRIMMESFINRYKSLAKQFKIVATGQKIVGIKNRMFSTPLSKDSKREDGHLVQMGLIDEFHAHEDNSRVSILETGMGAFDNPLLIIITTAGYNVVSVCKRLEDNYKKILSGEVENDFVFAMIYELDKNDDWEDTQNWYKVNPSLGGALKLDYMKVQYANMLIEGASAMLAFQVKNLNVWTNSLSKWISDRIWKESNDRVTITRQELKGRVCTGGFDGSSVSDLTAFSLYFELENGESAALTWFWCPENSAYERAKKDGVQYLDWIADGFILATPGDAVDMELVAYDILDILKDYKCKAINFDSWGTGVFVKVMKDEGWGERIHPFSQSTSSYNNPIKHFSRTVLNRRFKHFDNPVFTWNVMNVLLVRDTNDNLKFDKNKSNDKIDGAVSVVMAVGANLSIKEIENPYANRGLRVL